MFIKKITIENFKAIDKATLELSNFTVLVGENGSGKSSVLQALHWVFQSGRNRSVTASPNVANGSTLSENEATYMPSPEYRNSGNGAEYGNFQNSPKLDLSVVALNANGDEINANLWIKSARNEGISVHIPSGNSLTAVIRDQKREFSSYIPGLAGIPLIEEKRSKLIVQRLAAAGDANTVLRNILDLLRKKSVGGQNGLEIVESYVSRVMSELSISVEFDEDKHTRIFAKFQTKEMKDADARRFKPLELAGIGFLQVIQIFSYLVYFRPAILLVDEPDSHLHPTAQEKLVTVLAEAARRFGTQVILTTHSPSVVRALPADTKVIWMKRGEVQVNGDNTARNLMGWGLLDKRVILMTEDSGSAMLRSILSQWPDLERMTAVWPFHGTGKMPAADTIKGLRDLFGETVKIVIHRDRDFMMPEEVNVISEAYQQMGIPFWTTKQSDIEAYWCDIRVIKVHFNIDDDDAKTILDDAFSLCCLDGNDLIARRKKRVDTVNKIRAIGQGTLPQFGDVDVEARASEHGEHYKVLGKTLVSAIRKVAKDRELEGASAFGKIVPKALPFKMSSDLEVILRDEI